MYWDPEELQEYLENKWYQKHSEELIDEDTEDEMSENHEDYGEYPHPVFSGCSDDCF